MNNPWERNQVDTDPEGFILPDGRRYRWIDSQVELEVKAVITTPDGETLTLGCKFTEEDAVSILLELLDKTT